MHAADLLPLSSASISPASSGVSATANIVASHRNCGAGGVWHRTHPGLCAGHPIFGLGGGSMSEVSLHSEKAYKDIRRLHRAVVDYCSTEGEHMWAFPK